MEITSIRVKKIKNGGNILGYASIQLDNCIVIHDIKLVEYDGKRILSFPNKKIKKYVMEDGNYSETNTYTDIVHPSNIEFRKYLEESIFSIYDKEDLTDEQRN